LRILIDAGHGGKEEPGAIANGIIEKDLNLVCALAFKKKLETYENVEIVMTRTNDDYFDLDKRSAWVKSQNHDLALSFHFNAGGGSGTEIIKSINADQHIKVLADLLGSNIASRLGVNLRRVYARTGTSGKDYYALHRNGTSRMLILEPLFLDNSVDAGIIKSDGFISRYTDTVLGSVIRMYDLRKKVAKLDWKEIIKKVASNPTEWEAGISTAVAAAKADGNLGALEIFQYLPVLIEKIYNSK
jgi:N-acetylmuramoyl-L-alanine amidase